MSNGFAPIVYWFPGVKSVPDAYKARFTDPVTGNDKFSAARDAKGPVDGERGIMISPFDGCVVMYNEDRQRWDEIEEGVWLGADCEAEPEAFRLDTDFSGVAVKMADGHYWELPIANPLVGTCSLPLWHRLNKHRQWEVEVQAEYRELSQRAADISQELIRQLAETGSPNVELDDDRLRGIIVDALKLNYNITLEELSALRVFSPDTYWPALSAILDWDTQMEILQAEDSEASALDPFTDPGNTGSTADGEKD